VSEERRAVRGSAEHLVDLAEPPVEVDELGAALADELIVEAVLTKHLEYQPTEVAHPFVADLEQGTPLAAEDARGRKDDARRPAAAKVHCAR
jgi:hypothetical protein